jgi:hypothetical protein
MTTTYRTSYSNGRSSTEHATMTEAETAVREAMGWESIATSDSFAIGSCEGKRGSVYGVECYSSDEECDAAVDGNPHAPRILIIEGDEAWAMGRDA